MKNEKNFSRENIYYGKVALYNRQMDKIIKDRIVLFNLSENAVTNNVTSPALFYDLFYKTPKYATTSLEGCKIFEVSDHVYCIHNYYDLNQLNGNIFVYNRINLNTLLKYFGFPVDMTAQDCMDMYKNLFDGIFAYENCKLFGYQKKPALIWKNGMLVAREKKLDKYSMSSYDKVEENKLTPYFKMLNQIDYHNPEACFEPFEEEGQIRKRML